MALLSGLSEQQRADLEGLELSQKAQADLIQAQANGYASSFDEVIPGVGSVAVPLLVAGQLPASLAVVFPRQEVDEAHIANLLRRGAQDIIDRLGAA